MLFAGAGEKVLQWPRYNNSSLLGEQEHERVLCLDQAYKEKFCKASVNLFVSIRLRESNFYKAYSLVFK